MLVHRIRHAEHGIPAKQDVDAAAAATGSAGLKGSADYAGEDIFDQEDVFSECLPSLFPDETFTFVGNPGEVLEYASPLFGSVIVHLPGHGNGVSGDSHSTADEHSHATQENTGESVNTQGLFAHLLWGAALIVSDEIEKTAAKLRSQAASHEPLSLERQLWRVQGEDVLELGAGVCYSTLCPVLPFCAWRYREIRILMSLNFWILHRLCPPVSHRSSLWRKQHGHYRSSICWRHSWPKSAKHGCSELLFNRDAVTIATN